MGEMTIRDLDEGTLLELAALVRKRGLKPEALAADLLRKGLRRPMHDRAAVARAVQAAQPRRSERDSVDDIRDDRSRR